MMTTLLALALVTGAFAVAFAILLVLGFLNERRASSLRGSSQSERGSIVFLFENETLRDATPAARELLETGPRRGTAWARLSALLTPRFPHLSESMADLATLGEIERLSSDGTSVLHAEWHDGIARLTLGSSGDHACMRIPDRHALAAMAQELDSLRIAAEHTPFPIWREGRGGDVTWCNRAYLDLVEALDTESDHRGWPPRRIFDLPTGDQADNQTNLRRAITPLGQDRRHWFTIDVRTDRDGQLCTATPADDLVKAENALKEFVTTLTKTFAALPIGMALFNRDRELAMFNPALLDLTSLPVDFLIARPSLASVLDRMREIRMMPEPKDYKSWRQHVSDLATQAQNGTFEENWTLPGGQTYRVTGRPHPDGAVAFLFEDISAEVSLSRRFRTEIEIGQAALDALPNGIAVFSTAGVLTMSNSSYAEVWGHDPNDQPCETSIFDAVENWRRAAAPNAIWDDIRAFVGHAGTRTAWESQIMLNDGRMVNCRVAPMPRGYTMVDFTLQSHSDSLVEIGHAKDAPILIGARG